MKSSRKWLTLAALLTVAVCTVVGTVGYRALRLWRVTTNFEERIRYLIENGGTIGEMPAKEALSVGFLQAIFGDNPELLEKLKNVVQKGLSDEPALNVGEVTAMIVTYNQTKEGKIENIAVHAIGGFPLARAKPGMHRSGYFFQQVDRNLWGFGNIIISFLGRDVILFAADEQTSQAQQALLDSMFSGEIKLLVERLATPMYFTAVFPDPRNIVPNQLHSHIQSAVIKGSLGYYEGHWEMLALTPSPKSAEYAYSILKDMKAVAELTLRTRFSGNVKQSLWGPWVDTWWSYEMAEELKRTTLQREQNLIRAKLDFERVMVNAVLKTVERISRDLAQMRGSLEELKDPRVVDAGLKTKKPMHYWSEDHRWGPDWPIPPVATTNPIADTATSEPESASAATQSVPEVVSVNTQQAPVLASAP
ncbi:MAG: hypothetical protein V1873_01120 [Verrucomicrobiota bacterium]